LAAIIMAIPGPCAVTGNWSMGTKAIGGIVPRRSMY
jgi:hypothetical protein